MSVVTWLTCIFAGAVVFAFLGYIAYIKKTDMETVASASGKCPGSVQTFNFRTSRAQACQCLVVKTPMDNK